MISRFEESEKKMNKTTTAISGIEKWREQYHPAWIDFLRILLGIFLIAKGVSFINDRKQIEWILEKNHVDFLIFLAANYIIVCHFAGGMLIAAGLITRWAVGFQLPILIAAVFFVNFPKQFSGINSELGISIAVLILLLFFFYYGSGNYSVDYYLATHIDT